MPSDVENQAENTRQWASYLSRTKSGGTSAAEDVNNVVSVASSLTSLVATAMDGAKGWTTASDVINLVNTASASIAEVASTGSARKNPYYLAVQAASFSLAAARLGLEKGFGEDLSKWASVGIDAGQILLNHVKQKVSPSEAKNGYKLKSSEVTELNTELRSLRSEVRSLQASLSQRNSPTPSRADLALSGYGAGNSAQTLPAVTYSTAPVPKKRSNSQ